MLLIKKTAKRVLAAVLAAICVLFVSCAPDLGDVENESDYGEKFPGVKFVKSDLNVSEMSIGELYNESAVNNFNDKNFESPTESDKYKYMAVFVREDEDLSVKEFAIYLRSEADVTLNICVYRAAGLPETIATGDSNKDFKPSASIGESGESSESSESSSAIEEKELKKFDEPTRENAVAEVAVLLKAGKWVSFSVRTWKTDDGQKSSILLEKGSCLLFQFQNNCVVYDNEGKIVRNDDNPPVAICFTAMLICVG